MRIFLGLTEVSGFFHRLQRGFAEIGIEAQHVTLQIHRFAYADSEQQNIIVRWAQAAVTRRNATQQSNPLRRVIALIEALASRTLLFIWAIVRFDVFILGAGSSFFSFRELPLLKLLGKKVFYTLHGTDARPPYVDGYFDPSHYGMHSAAPANETPVQRAERLAPFHAEIATRRASDIRRIEKNVTAIICGPSYSQFLSRPFIDFYTIGLPISAAEGFATNPIHDTNTTSVRILHAPSYSAAKGTEHIRAVIKNLQEDGHSIDYIELQNKTHLEVFQELGRCDILVDQSYSDTPLAALAAEAGLLGKPAVVGGYFSVNAETEITPGHVPPSAFCLPENMYQAIDELVRDSAQRRRIGDSMQNFVVQRWNAAAVARRCLRAINELPEEWLASPWKLAYVHGSGLNETQARTNVAALIKHAGIASLCLAHNPELERRFASFATEQAEC